MTDTEPTTEPWPEQDQAQKSAFHEAVWRLDLLRAGGGVLTFEEPELEATFARHAGADLYGVAFQVEKPGEHPGVAILRELEHEFVQLAEVRWRERAKEFPQLENLANEWRRAFERGGEMSPLQVRKALGVTNSYEEKLERRRERLEAAAERASQRSQAAYEASNRAVEHIPLGQPILVGHHSERRHRRDLERAHRAMDRSLEEQRRAEELERKAKGVGKAGISADDPDAPEKLRERLHGLERRRDEMKRVNAQFKKAGGNLRAVEGLSDETRQSLEQDMARAPWHRAPFPPYALTNIGSNIRRIRERILALEEKAEEPPRPALEGRGYRLEEDDADNRIRFMFDSKPPEEQRTLLKSMGFHWSPTAGAWQRQASPAGWAAAERVRAELDQGERPERALHYYASPWYFAGEQAPRGWIIRQRHTGGFIEEGVPREPDVFWTKEQAETLAKHCSSGESVPGIRWSTVMDGD